MNDEYTLPMGPQSEDSSFQQRGLLPMVHEGQPRPVFPGGKTVKPDWVRILPAFDPSISTADPAYQTSFIPYRDRGQIGTDSLPPFTAWYTTVRGYRFFGRAGSDFMSRTMIPEAVLPDGVKGDPVVDCYNLAKSSQIAEWRNLTIRPETAGGGKDRAVLGWPSEWVVFNGLVHFDNKPQNETSARPFMLTSTAFDFLKKQADWNPPYHRQGGTYQGDPAWPEFLFGDFTSPTAGLKGMITQLPSNNAARPWGVRFSLNDNQPTGTELMPLSGPAELQGRVQLNSLRYWYIPTYQEVVDLLLDDGVLPFELIRQACGHKANIASQAHSSATTETVSAPAQGWPQTPPQAAPAQAWPQTAPQAAPAQPWPQTPPQAAPAQAWPSTPTTPPAPAANQAWGQVPAPAGPTWNAAPSNLGGGWGAAPVQATVPPAPTAAQPPAPTATPEVKYWVSINQTPAVLKTEAEVKELVAQGQGAVLALMLQTATDQTWRSVADFPQLQQATAAAPVAAAPAMPAAAPVSQPAAPPVGGGLQHTPQEAAEYQALQQRIAQGDPTMTGADYQRFAVLSAPRA